PALGSSLARTTPSLRLALLTRFYDWGLQPHPDQLEHIPVQHSHAHATQKLVVRNRIEEFLQIQVHYIRESLGDILLRPCHRLMCRPSRPESIAAVGERPVPAVLQHLHHRLLNEPIYHRWNA